MDVESDMQLLKNDVIKEMQSEEKKFIDF
jgi:hypothetical protein